MRPSFTTFRLSSRGGVICTARSVSSLSTSAGCIAQRMFTVILGWSRWNSTRRGASQKVPIPSVTLKRTSPCSVALWLLARRKSNDAASMRLAAASTSSPSGVMRTPSTWRVTRVRPSRRSKPLSLWRSVLRGMPSLSAAARKLPLRTTSRKTRAPAQSGIAWKFSCSTVGTPFCRIFRIRTDQVRLT